MQLKSVKQLKSCFRVKVNFFSGIEWFKSLGGMELRTFGKSFFLKVPISESHSKSHSESYFESHLKCYLESQSKSHLKSHSESF